LVTYSQQEKGWPKQEDYNCPKCDFYFYFFVMSQSQKPITEGKKLNFGGGGGGVIHMANQYNKTHEYKPNKR